MTNIYIRSKADGATTRLSSSDSYALYDWVIRHANIPHDEAANFQGWGELAGPGEIYRSIGFYAEVLND